MKPSAPHNWEAGIRALHAEAGGVLSLMLVTAADAVALIAAAEAGDGRALAYLRVLNTFRLRIEGATDDAPLCLTCDRRLGVDTPLSALVIPACDDASQCLAVGLCVTCAARHRDSAAAVTAIIGVLRVLWPGLRPIAPPAAVAERA
jgi:hypothetical protein